MLNIYNTIPSDIFTETISHNIEMINLCNEVIDESSATSDIMEKSGSYINSLIMELLENSYKFLSQLYTKILNMMNNYILNHVSLINKYKEFIKEKLKTLDKPFIYETYEYNDNPDYPKIIHSDSSIIVSLKRIEQYVNDPEFSNTNNITSEVDSYLEQFSSALLGDTVNVDDLQNSVVTITTNHIKGTKKIKRLTENDITEFIAYLSNYKTERANIIKTQSNMVKEYNLLKLSYKKIVSAKNTYEKNTLLSYYDSEKEELKAQEYKRFSDINTEIMRLYNGYITIYSTAFSTKLNILRDKYTNNTDTINKLLIATSFFAKFHTEKGTKNNKPIQNVPNLIM